MSGALSPTAFRSADTYPVDSNEFGSFQHFAILDGPPYDTLLPVLVDADADAPSMSVTHEQIRAAVAKLNKHWQDIATAPRPAGCDDQ